MIVTVSSGKGGTGKTFIATNLSHMLSCEGKSVAYVDADVEAPNGHLFLHPKITEQAAMNVLVPFSPSGSCIGCGNCQTICAFNAIIVMGKQIIVFDELCHSCGACILACKDNYLSEKFRATGVMETGRADAISFYSGTMNMGETRAAPLISDLITHATTQSAQSDFIIIDSPPGASCAAVAAVESSDLVILVVEPTPLGVHDFELAVKMAKELNKPIAAIINRANLGTVDVTAFLKQQKIPLLAQIDFDKKVADCGANGQIAASEHNLVHDQLTPPTKWLLTYKHEREQSGSEK